MTYKQQLLNLLWKSGMILPAALVFFLFFENAHAAVSARAQLIGSWEIYKDDDRPKGPVPEERMSFGIDGKFEVMGDFSYNGRYLVKGNAIEFTFLSNGREVSGSREFEVNDTVLKFKNPKNGWVYYKRISVGSNAKK